MAKNLEDCSHFRKKRVLIGISLDTRALNGCEKPRSLPPPFLPFKVFNPAFVDFILMLRPDWLVGVVLSLGDAWGWTQQGTPKESLHEDVGFTQKSNYEGYLHHL